MESMTGRVIIKRSDDELPNDRGMICAVDVCRAFHVKGNLLTYEYIPVV